MPQSSGLQKYTSWISCRQVLNILVIIGFMLNYALRVNLTIAMVAMVPQPCSKTGTCPLANGTHALAANLTTAALVAGNGTLSTPAVEHSFDWDAVKQNLIHGSFFWGYILTELPGGRLAELIGGRRVFGHSMLWASLLTLLTPAAAYLDYRAVVVLRALLGFMLGASWPAIHPMTAVWIKPMDRSKFMANMMASALGAAIALPVCGFLIEYAGWESVFYVTGGVGLLWSVFWFVFVFESPAVHPRISAEERREIEEAIGSSTSKKRPSYVPWASILTAPSVWAIIIVHGCSVFGYFTIVNQLPTYMNRILHFDIKANGLLSSLPYIGKYAMAIIASTFADYLRRTEKLTTTQTRKMFTAFAVLLPSLLMIVQIFVGYDRTWSVVIFTTQLFLNGAVTAGYLGNGLDIAPNFSGTIFGLANTLSSAGGWLSTFMVGTLTKDDQSYGQWQIVFGVLAAAYFAGGLAYVLLGSGELQPWNNPPERNGDVADVEEEVPLKKNNLAIK